MAFAGLWHHTPPVISREVEKSCGEQFPVIMKRKGPMWSKKLISSINFFKKSIDKN